MNTNSHQTTVTLQHSVRINQLVLGGFGLIVLLAAISAVVSQVATQRVSEANHEVRHTYDIEVELKSLESELLDAETGKRGFVITNQDHYLEPYNRSLEQIDTSFNNLRTLTADEPDQAERIATLEALTDDKLEEMAMVIRLKRQGQEAELLELISANESQETMDAIRRELSEIIEIEDQLLAVSGSRADRAEMLAAWINWGSLLVISGLAAVVSLVVVRVLNRALSRSLQQASQVANSVAAGDLTVIVDDSSTDEIGKLMTTLKQMIGRLTVLVGGVKQSGIQVTSSATQIAASGKQLEATLREQVATTTQTTSTATQIAATAQELAKTMEEVTLVSQTTTTAVSSSQTRLTEMETTIHQLMDSTATIANRLGMISEKANSINSVVTTITKVADQTNLLSLNAAIEAEKAGEYGAGFSVVAREIRRLADQTAVATLDIESIIKEMQSSVSAGVMEMDKFSTEVTQSVSIVADISGQVAGVIQQVQMLAPRFAQVNEGMDSQAQGAQQISEAMMQLNDVSLQTSHSLEGINQAIAQLNQAAQGLQKEMAQFKVGRTTQLIDNDFPGGVLDQTGPNETGDRGYAIA